MTATWSPGFPIVVRFLVRSRVRPAAAPESTWTAASRSGPAAAGASAGAAFGGGGAAGCAGDAGAGAERWVRSSAAGGGAEGLMLVWVLSTAAEAADGAGAAAGAGALAGLRMIIVFSKSAALACAGASL